MSKPSIEKMIDDHNGHPKKRKSMIKSKMLSGVSLEKYIKTLSPQPRKWAESIHPGLFYFKSLYPTKSWHKVCCYNVMYLVLGIHMHISMGFEQPRFDIYRDKKSKNLYLCTQDEELLKFLRGQFQFDLKRFMMSHLSINRCFVPFRTIYFVGGNLKDQHSEGIKN